MPRQDGFPSQLPYSSSGQLVTYNSWSKLETRTFDRGPHAIPCYSLTAQTLRGSIHTFKCLCVLVGVGSEHATSTKDIGMIHEKDSGLLMTRLKSDWSYPYP